VCADKFRALPDVAAKTIALSKVESWNRAEEFPKEFVTLPGETSPSSALVKACYGLLVPKSAALQWDRREERCWVEGAFRVDMDYAMLVSIALVAMARSATARQNASAQ
jgi:hypothetical protein